MNRAWLPVIGVVIAAGEGACGREGAAPPGVVVPSRQPGGAPAAPGAASATGITPPPNSSAAAAPPPSPTESAARPSEQPVRDPARPRPSNDFYSSNMAQEDPVGPPRPQCPDVAPLVKAWAVMKQEPVTRRHPHPSPGVLDVELTVTLPPNPGQTTLVANRVSVFGGVLVEETVQASTPGKDVLLIRPMGGVARETSLMVLFGLVCKDKDASGSLRIQKKAAVPWRDGDPVIVGGVTGY